jgi:hypothetical protein
MVERLVALEPDHRRGLTRRVAQNLCKNIYVSVIEGPPKRAGGVVSFILGKE